MIRPGRDRYGDGRNGGRVDDCTRLESGRPKGSGVRIPPVPLMTNRTVTSRFGSGNRESHDASIFYERFRPPEISDDDTVHPAQPVDESFICGDARQMSAIANNSVALVVTSPPYFAGKQYEEELGSAGVPASYLEYLEMLTAVFAECVRVLEPGGRIAVNVANLGRRPYRSLSADVIGILERDLGLLLRGEIIWRKAEGAGGSCAWGSYRRAGNPVLRDLTERIIVASKGRFDRARSVQRRAAEGLPYESTLPTDDFLQLTLDVWDVPPESARRIGHPAPFPVELPEQLIRLYSYRNDLVLDPFMGSGSTLVAAARLDRRYVGYDLDPGYVELAHRRVMAEGAVIDEPESASSTALAEAALLTAGFEITARQRRVRGTGTTVDVIARDAQGDEWWFDVAGSQTSWRPGLQRAETVTRTLGTAAALRHARGNIPLVVLTNGLPRQGSDTDAALRAAGYDTIFDVIHLRDPAACERLAAYGAGRPRTAEPTAATDRSDLVPLPGFWDGSGLNTPA